jgi:hypothetical protein
MMKIAAAVLSMLGMAASSDIKADSLVGMKLLEKATRELNQNQNNPYFDHTWVAGYSLKFEGCHHISQWNKDANDGGDVRIATKRLVRFRLCPTDFCNANKGCTAGYGDYIVDMESYIEAWFEAKSTYQAFKCDYLTNNVCSCADADNKNNCLWDCYADHNMEGICMENNPYGDGSNKQFYIENYMQCTKSNIKNNNGERELANGEWDGNYYIGPYCADQGGAIYLGVFTDDSCTTFADSNGGRAMYYALTGSNLPYSQTNIIDMDCMSCKEPSENNNGGNDQVDEDEVAEVCENIYTLAGKCEANLPSGTAYLPNNNACKYMEGIKIARSDGTVVSAAAVANKTASVFIGGFVVSFILLTAYVYYLKTKLDRASINLAE